MRSKGRATPGSDKVNGKYDRLRTKINQVIEEIKASIKINRTENHLSEEEINYLLEFVKTIEKEIEEIEREVFLDEQ